MNIERFPDKWARYRQAETVAVSTGGTMIVCSTLNDGSFAGA
jgi:hypothetical protein